VPARIDTYLVRGLSECHSQRGGGDTYIYTRYYNTPIVVEYIITKRVRTVYKVIYATPCEFTRVINDRRRIIIVVAVVDRRGIVVAVVAVFRSVPFFFSNAHSAASGESNYTRRYTASVQHIIILSAL